MAAIAAWVLAGAIAASVGLVALSVGAVLDGLVVGSRGAVVMGPIADMDTAGAMAGAGLLRQD